MQLLQIQNIADKRLRQHATLALAKMGDPQACEQLSQMLLDPDPGFVIETARHLGRFPRGSRNRVFEAISRLPNKEKDIVISNLDRTPLDFSKEREMLQTPGWVAAHIPL